MAADRLAVTDLVKGLRLSESLLQDLDHFYETHRDVVSYTLIPGIHLQPLDTDDCRL